MSETNDANIATAKKPRRKKMIDVSVYLEGDKVRGNCVIKCFQQPKNIQQLAAARLLEAFFTVSNYLDVPIGELLSAAAKDELRKMLDETSAEKAT